MGEVQFQNFENYNKAAADIFGVSLITFNMILKKSKIKIAHMNSHKSSYYLFAQIQ